MRFIDLSLNKELKHFFNSLSVITSVESYAWCLNKDCFFSGCHLRFVQVFLALIEVFNFKVVI